MSTVLTILQEKGGVGKSLATMNIAYYLSRKSKVLIIDLDGQAANITYYMLGKSNSLKTTDFNIMDMFKGRVDMKDIIIPIKQNLDIIPANVDVANLSRTDKISLFKQQIEEMKKIYDYIMIDVTPSPTWAHLLALSSKNQKIIPIINADASSLKALISLHETVDEVKETINPTAEYLGIIVNRYDGRTRIAKEIIRKAEDIAKQIGTSLFDTYIHQSVILNEQTLAHTSIFEYAPGSKVAKDYECLGAEILKRIAKGEDLK